MTKKRAKQAIVIDHREKLPDPTNSEGQDSFNRNITYEIACEVAKQIVEKNIIVPRLSRSGDEIVLQEVFFVVPKSQLDAFLSRYK